MTLAQLRQYDGSDREKTILVSVNGRIFNVWRGRSLYETGGSYELFAGRECGLALSKMCATATGPATVPLCHCATATATAIALPAFASRPFMLTGVSLAAGTCVGRSFEHSDLDGRVKDLPASAQSLLNEWLESYEMKVRFGRTHSLCLPGMNIQHAPFVAG